VVARLYEAYASMPWQTAALFLAAFLGLLTIIILLIDGWRQGKELRSIRRRIRKDVKAKHKRFISNRKIAERRVEWSPKATRAYMLAMRLPKKHAELSADTQETA